MDITNVEFPPQPFRAAIQLMRTKLRAPRPTNKQWMRVGLHALSLVLSNLIVALKGWQGHWLDNWRILLFFTFKKSWLSFIIWLRLLYFCTVKHFVPMSMSQHCLHNVRYMMCCILDHHVFLYFFTLFSSHRYDISLPDIICPFCSCYYHWFAPCYTPSVFTFSKPFLNCRICQW